jgi:hypothetical protein
MLQATRLETHGGQLTALRDEPFLFELRPPPAGVYHGE